jgi:hypothetical protein
MNKIAGYMVSELVTGVIIFVVTVAIGFGLYVNNERDKMVESAEASLAAVKKQAAAAAEEGKLIACDNSLVEADVLANAFVSLSIRPTTIVAFNLDEGYGAGIYVQSSQKVDGGDAFYTSKLFYEAVKEKDEDALRLFVKEDDEIEYSILVSESASCATAEQVTEI